MADEKPPKQLPRTKPTPADLARYLGPVPKGTKKLTRRQLQLVIERMWDPTASMDELGRRAGYISHQRKSAWRALQSTNVREVVRRLLDEYGGTSLAGLVAKLNEGLEADRVQYFQRTRKDGKETIHEVIEKRDPDFAVRHKYITTGFKLHGALDADEENHGAGGQGLCVEVLIGQAGTPEDRQRFAQAMVALRISRGLHPTENRELSGEEQKDWAAQLADMKKGGERRADEGRE